MSESVPISAVEGWFNDLTSTLRKASVESKTNADHFVNQGMNDWDCPDRGQAQDLAATPEICPYPVPFGQEIRAGKEGEPR